MTVLGTDDSSVNEVKKATVLAAVLMVAAVRLSFKQLRKEYQQM